MSDIPDISPINMTPEEARAIEAKIDAQLGALSDAEVNKLALALDNAAVDITTSREYIRKIVAIVLPILKSATGGIV